jgi:hypothetical protein
MATPEEILQVICPSFLTTSGYSIYLDMAERITSSGYYGDLYSDAVALTAAHKWFLNSQRKGQTGVVTYAMEGRLAKSYGGIGVTKNELELTAYGQQLISLRNSICPAVTITSQDIIGRY